MEDKNEPDQLRGDEEIIELTDVVDESPLEAEEEFVELTGEADDATGEELDFDLGDEDDFVSSLGVEIETEEESSADLAEADVVEGQREEPDTISVPEQAPVSIAPEQVEEALESVIKKMFSEKIEGILGEVIERAVKQEIEKIKTALLEDTTGNE